MHTHRRAAGFTLVELMITIAILAIVMGIAVPSFNTLIKNNRLTSTSNDIAGVLQFARAEAVRRGRSVDVRARAGNIENGLGIWADENGTDTILREVQFSVPSLALRAEVNNTEKENVQISINGRGEASTPLKITVCDDRKGAHGRELELIKSGVLRLTSGTNCN